MKNPARTAKVVVSLIVSMTLGAGILMALDDKAISEGAFSLASYTRLNSIDKAANPVEAALRQWEQVEVYCANISSDTDSHFTIYNDVLGEDGVIEQTNSWRKQRSCDADGSKTIRVCVVTGVENKPSDCQLKRTAALIEKLRRKCGINNRDIYYPSNWQI
ncbi:hypothetical protein STSP2_00229 [Anaerohalosphaera lusitana]|uniref:Uncharacterized protein n=1 Tax=Anaerohalosphaera lusitana TaxID=1936003 RepID=A0A1U9NGN2_9BACT|nr:N-acetylmuramoyl-L-alanine amidase [Anaerohalosphaera lusitana]AQT67089.1 hypothetical protein STSP2_00229 [Anaerohalosphaera lusitana]